MLPIKPLPRVIGIVFESGGKSIFSKIIRLLTHSQYSHVEFLLENGETVGSRELEGVKYRKIDRFNKPEIFYFCNAETGEVKSLSDNEQIRLQMFIVDNLGKKYDYKGILGYLLSKDGYHGKDDWFCSEFVFFGCKKIGRKLSNRSKCYYVSPADIANSLRIRKKKNDNSDKRDNTPVEGGFCK